MNWTTSIILNFISCYILLSVIIHVCIAAISIIKTKYYYNKNSFTDYNTLVSSSNAPNISVITVAYNQTDIILNNVKQLLSTHYNNLEIIIINNSNSDNVLKELIDTYNLQPVNVFIDSKIPTEKIKTIYKSKNPIYKKIIVVDKPKTNKADCLNTGINIASSKYITHINSNCILEQDAILKLLQPFLEETTQKIIATGGIIQTKADTTSTPQTFLKKVINNTLVLKHSKTLLLEYMGGTKLNELLFSSGLFMVFDKKTAIESGGYSSEKTGEDIELIMRMRRYMQQNKTPYKVVFIPENLCCKKEEPNIKNLISKQSSWIFKLLESFNSHKKIFFNRAYGSLGLFNYPYWLFFKFLVPFFKGIIFTYLIATSLLGQISWELVFNLFILLYSLKITHSFIAILTEIIIQDQHHNNYSISKKIATAILEPFVLNPISIISFFKGSFQYIKRK